MTPFQKGYQQRLAVERQGSADQRDGGNGGSQCIHTDQKTALAFLNAQPLSHLRQSTRRLRGGWLYAIMGSWTMALRVYAGTVVLMAIGGLMMPRPRRPK